MTVRTTLQAALRAAVTVVLGTLVLTVGMLPAASAAWLSAGDARSTPTAGTQGKKPPRPSASPTASPTTTTTPSPTPTPTPAAKPVQIPVSASGELAVVPGRAAPAGPGRPLTYRVEVERGLPLDGADVAEQMHRVLTDPRGWQPIEGVAFGRTTGPAGFRLIVASPALTDRLCYPLDTIGELSCRNGDMIILNARRWATGVPWYAGRMADYRAYLVNHEVGHRLGHGHKGCPAPGAPAPVMVQQSKSLYGCKPNPWPSVAY
jgi:hypothetical protein